MRRTRIAATTAKWATVAALVLGATGSGLLFMREGRALETAERSEASAALVNPDMLRASKDEQMYVGLLADAERAVHDAELAPALNADVIAYDPDLGAWFYKQIADTRASRDGYANLLADARGKVSDATEESIGANITAGYDRGVSTKAHQSAVLFSGAAGVSVLVLSAIAFALSMSAAKARAMVALAARPAPRAKRSSAPKDSS